MQSYFKRGRCDFDASFHVLALPDSPVINPVVRRLMKFLVPATNMWRVAIADAGGKITYFDMGPNTAVAAEV